MHYEHFSKTKNIYETKNKKQFIHLFVSKHSLANLDAFHIEKFFSLTKEKEREEREKKPHIHFTILIEIFKKKSHKN